MFLKSIILSNFKIYKEPAEIKFGRDVSVIKRPNEQGKSTLIEGILAGLFDDVKSKSAKIKEYQSWGAGALPSIAIEFESEGTTWRLQKNFEAKTAELLNLDTGEKIENPKTVQEKINQTLGFSSKEMAEKIAVIRQGALPRTENKDISSAFEIVATGGGENVRAAEVAKHFDDALKALAKTGRERKNYGILQNLAEKINEKKARLAEISARLSNFARFLDKEKDLSVQLKDCREKLESKNKVWQASKEIKECRAREKTLAGNLSQIENWRLEFEKAAKILEEKEKISREFSAQFGSLGEARGLRQAISEKSGLKKQKEKDLERFSGKERFEHSKTADFFRKRRILILAAAAACAAGAAVLAFLVSLAFLVFLAVPAALFFFLWNFSGGRDKEIEKFIGVLRRDIGELEKELADFSEKSGGKTFEKILDDVAFFEANEAEAEKSRYRIENLSAAGGKEKKEAEYREALREKTALEEKIKQIKDYAEEEPEKFAKLDSEKKKLEEKEKEANRSLAVLEGQKKEYENLNPEEKISLEEELEALEAELKNWRKRKEVFEAAMNAVLEAKASVGGEIKRTLVDFVGDYIEEITDGKYREITLDENFNFFVFSREKGEKIALPGPLSAGAIDQIYAALRFGFLKMLAGKDVRPFVILDDPFHSFDKQRLAKTKNIINELKRQFQIIILTCHDEYDDWR